MPRENVSQDALSQADQTRNKFSTYGDVLGQAGVQDIDAKLAGGEFLSRAGDKIAISPQGASGFEEIYIGCAWNARVKPSKGFFGRLLGRSAIEKFDLDLGCLYELQDGTVGALQALGADNGAFDHPPFIVLSRDERSGLSDGDDEYIRLNGAAWPKIKRVLIYTYIYSGGVDWSHVAPQIQLKTAGQATLKVSPTMANNQLKVCAIAMMENVRNGFTLLNLTEYFPGQPEMDRAYGFGLNWGDGVKSPL